MLDVLDMPIVSKSVDCHLYRAIGDRCGTGVEKLTAALSTCESQMTES